MSAQQPAPASPSQALQFTDPAECKRWIDTLPLAKAQEAQLMLAGQLAALRTATLSPVERLGLLEMLKGPVDFVQQESANRYAGRLLPLGAGERAVWDSVRELWADLLGNYQLCLQAYRDGDLDIAPHAALITMRCLECMGKDMVDCYRVYRRPPAAAWRALHELHAFAEQHGYARIRASDAFAQRDPDSSCQEAYLQALLVHLANPYALSARQLGFVQRWAAKWAPLVTLSAQPVPAGGQAPALAVDLSGSNGLQFAAEIEPGEAARHVDLEPLSKTLRQNITLLKQGQTPAQLGLGETARQPGCENLLMLLYVQWCRAGTGRGEERQQTQETTSVCFGLPSTHFQVSGGREFRQPGELTSREKQDLDTFGYIMRSAQEAGSEAEKPETWQILNRSTSGFMCMLREPTSHTHVGHNQIIAVGRGKAFQLGMVQWMRVEDNGEICCGVRLFPGAPQAVAVRPSNFTAGANRYERALLLPEVPAAATPATLVLPQGWYRSGRFIEVFTDRKQTAKLVNLLEAGCDFDRCTITLI